MPAQPLPADGNNSADSVSLCVSELPPRVLDGDPLEEQLEGEANAIGLRRIGPEGRGYLYEAIGTSPEQLADDRPAGRLFLFISRRDTDDALYPPGMRPHVHYRRSPDAERTKLGLSPRDVITLASFHPAKHDSAHNDLVIYLTGVDGVRYPDRRLIQSFQEYGWSVLVVTPSSDLVQQVDYVVSGSINSLAQRIAARIDNHIAERVYAVEAAAAKISPGDSLNTGRRVIVGVSAGALGAPALVVAGPYEADAVVLIGGGADVFRIIRTGSLTSNRINFIQAEGLSGDGESKAHMPADGVVGDIAEAVLLASRLDPYHLAPALRHIPVLQLHARFDAIVPAETGEVLHKRLGHPERWVFQTGHIGMFLLLPLQASRLVQWIDSAVPQDRAAGACAGSGRQQE